MLSTRRSVSALAALSVVAAATVALTTLPAGAAVHLPVAYGLTADDRIVSFLVEQPGAAPRSTFPIGGLMAGDDVVGLDIRPVSGEVYVLINGALADRVAVVDPATGALSKSQPLSTQLSGASFGVDFNPVVDRLRIVSDGDQNLRVNVDNGAVIVDKPLTYRAGDVGAGSDPSVTSAAYENNVPGGSSTATPATELYGIDTQRDSMVEIDPPNDGILRTVGSLGVGDVTAISGFDIAGSDLGSPNGYAVLTVAGVDALYTVNTDTGTAGKAGDFPAGTTIEDLTVADPRFLIAATGTVTEGGATSIEVRRVGDLRFAGSVSFRTVDGMAVAGSDFAGTTGTLDFGVGEATRRITLTTTEDSATEGPETFTVVLSQPTGENSTLGRSSSTVTVVDNEEGRTYGLTTGNQIVTFSVSTPATVSARTAVTGLQPGEDLVGVDMRPATGELYAIGSSNRVYKVNPTTGAATAVGGPFTPALSGTSFGVDFNPVVDRIRVVSNTGQNLRLHPDTGQVAFVDRTLAYAATDPGNGTPPRVGAAAYSNNGPGATSTELYEIEVARDVLVTQTPPNDGTLVTDGPLGVTIADTVTVGMDIASFGGAAFAVFAPEGTTAPSLYRIDLDTGRASLIGLLGDPTIEDLTVVAVTPFVAPAPTASPSTSATPTATMSPSPGAAPGCARAAEVMLGRTTITATGSAPVSVTTTPNSFVELFAYSRPSTQYRVVRSGTTDANGTITFADLKPPTNTRLYAQQRGCAFGTQKVLNVRTQISLDVVRNGPRNYTFSGRLLPARPGGLIASLYRVTTDGRQILTAQSRASESTGQYVINRRFTGSGRFGFVVRTGQDLQNAPGASNVRSLLVF